MVEQEAVNFEVASSSLAGGAIFLGRESYFLYNKLMPSVSMHLAIAKRYADNHPNDIKDLARFMRGSIEPDFKKNLAEIRTRKEKMDTHFYEKIDSDCIDFPKFFNNAPIKIEDDYWKGYFLHLVADQLFYNDDFRSEYVTACESGIYLYNDYSIITPEILRKYKVAPEYDFYTDKVREYLTNRDGELEFLNPTKVFAFIEKVAAPNVSENIERFR